MPDYNKLFLDAEAGIFESCQDDKPQTITEDFLKINSSILLRLYDDSNGGALEHKLKIGFRGPVKKLTKDELSAIYVHLRDDAMLYKMTGDIHEYDRHLEAADYLRRKFKLPDGKIKTS